MTNLHWASSFFKQPILSITPLDGGLQHRIDLIKLADRSLWIAKIFSSQTWIGATNLIHLQFTEGIAAQVACKLANTHAAESIIDVLGEKAMIISYCEGEMLSVITADQAFILGGQLAQIHSLKLPTENAKPFPPIVVAPKTSVPVDLEPLIARCNEYRHYERDKWVVSHRDMHVGNIIWRNANSPHLIDWESAGLIHPFTELIGLATNNAGLALGLLNEQQFCATLLGYNHYAGHLPKEDGYLWELIFQSWLLWFCFCGRQGWQNEVSQTLETISLIRDNLINLKKWYAKLA